MTIKETLDLLLEADYSSSEAIIQQIKDNKIHIKNSKMFLNSPGFKDFLDNFIEVCSEENISINKVFEVVLLKKTQIKNNQIDFSRLYQYDIDGLKYYVKYRSSPAFKNLIKEFETTNMPIIKFHNEAQKIAEQTKTGQRNLRKAGTNEEDIKTIYEEGKWKVVRPMTWQSSVKAATFPFGKANWCTASSQAERFFNAYTNGGKAPLYIVSDGTRENTFQVSFNKENCDIQTFENDGTRIKFEKFPDAVLKACKFENKNLYEFAHFNDLNKGKTKVRKTKEGWKETIYYNDKAVGELEDYLNDNFRTKKYKTYEKDGDKINVDISNNELNKRRITSNNDDYVTGDKKYPREVIKDINRNNNEYKKASRDKGWYEPNENLKLRNIKLTKEQTEKLKQIDKEIFEKHKFMDAEEVQIIPVARTVDDMKGNYNGTLVMFYLKRENANNFSIPGNSKLNSFIINKYYREYFKKAREKNSVKDISGGYIQENCFNY